MTQMKEAGPENQRSASLIKNVLPKAKIKLVKLNSRLTEDVKSVNYTKTNMLNYCLLFCDNTGANCQQLLFHTGLP